MNGENERPPFEAYVSPITKVTARDNNAVIMETSAPTPIMEQLWVLPEVAHLTPVILGGEPPDPRRIPAGCRFHPRRPALADGTAAAAGIAARCAAEALPVLPAASGHAAACLLPVSLTA